MVEMTDDNDTLMFNLTSSKKEKRKLTKLQKNTDDDAKDSSFSTQQPKLLVKANKQAKEKKLSSPKKGTQDTQKTHGQDNLHFSSLFTSNPVTQPLIVQKQKSVSEPLFSSKTFSEMDIHPHLTACLKQRLQMEKMTKVQELTIPVLLRGQDALVKSCTGSGKTLSYAVPMLQKLQQTEPKITRSDGVYALIIVPTRELAIQCYETFSILTNAFTRIVPGCLMGGEKKKSEKSRLRKGINILVTTPGRLLDHLDHTACLSLEHLAWLVIDEADKLLEQSFENDLYKIIKKCNTNRQSILLSATLSKEVQNLAGMSLTNPVHIDISSSDVDKEFHDLTVPDNLKQYIVVVPPKLRLAILSGFIIDNCLKGKFKAVIFLFSHNSVDYHHALFSDVLAPFLLKKGNKCTFSKLHGDMKQEDRTHIFGAFKAAKEGVLLCTDVAARGLDLPSVDWIVQYSAPASVEIYVHRIGRTARIGKKGNSLQFLLPTENLFSNMLAEHKINFEEIPSSKYLQSTILISDLLLMRGKGTAEDCATALHTRYEKAVYEEDVLHKMASDAFASYVQSYASYPKAMRHILPFKSLHLGHMAKSFCLREAPSNLGGYAPYRIKTHNRKRSDSKPTNRNPQSNFKNDSSVGNFHSPKKFTNAPQVKRKLQDVSEFGSGLSDLAMNSGKKSKRKKH